MREPTPSLNRAVAVGRVSPRGVRLWLRSPGGGPHRVAFWREGDPGSEETWPFDMGDRSANDHTFVFEFPDHFPGARPLLPVTRYRFRITREDETLVGEGRFQTTPATAAQMPTRFAIGLASCHQPFNDEGELHERGRRMLRLARTAWERADVKQVFWLGDQLYVDFPPSQSMFDPEFFKSLGIHGRESLVDCSREEALAAYHQRYRRNWAQPEWQALLANFASYPILDDHEVVDNFGSLPEHHTEHWRHLRQASGAAYRHYQHSRIADSPPDHDGPYDYAFEYGSAAGYMLDVRSMRLSTDGEHARVFAPHQLDHFAAWLHANSEAPVVFIGVSVPLFFMPGFASRVARWIPGSFREDAHDRWMHPQYRRDRERLLEIIRVHQQTRPRQRVVLLSGDVHVGYISRCDWRTEPETSLYQMVSSSITHELSSMDWHLARHIPRTHFVLFGVGDRYARIHLLGHRFSRLFQQPVGGLNVGVVEVVLEEDEALLNFKLYGEDSDRPDEPKCLFESGFEPRAPTTS